MSARPRRAMVMAMDQNKLIGREGGLPWRIPADFKHFKALTTGKAIIMGRVTFSEDLKRPLPERCNIVVSRDRAWSSPGVLVAADLDEAYQLAEQQLPRAEECYVIGGAQLCREAMAGIERIYLTVIQASFEGDTWLDSFDFGEWAVQDERALAVGEGTDWPVVFYTLDRRR